MYYETLMEKLLDEDNDDVIELQPEGGEIIRFEQVGVVVYEGDPYAIMHPLQDGLTDDQVVVFKLDPDDEESTELVADEELAKKILEVYNDGIDEAE